MQSSKRKKERDWMVMAMRDWNRNVSLVVLVYIMGGLVWWHMHRNGSGRGQQWEGKTKFNGWGNKNKK